MLTQPVFIERTYKAFFLFGGLGGAAIGTQQARNDYRGIQGRFEVLGSVDNDPAACADFETLTGVRSACMDLFDREQYLQWNGKEPPADWHEATSEEIRAAAQDQDPDVVVVTAPCKGFSGLLSEEKSSSQRYQALNKLTFRGVFLALEAWKHNPPGIILFENVPRIATRGKKFLKDIKGLLAAYGYFVDDRQHDCGEVGGLAQHRRRYLLIARHGSKLISPVRNTPKLKVRAIGEVIGPMAMPDDPALGPMHRLPRLEWKTWLRLALIPPGGDWRDLQNIEAGQYRIVPHDGKHNMKFRVQKFDEPAATIIGQTDVQAGAPIVADLRQPHMNDEQTHGHKYHVVRFDQPAPTVTGSRLGSGAPAIADLRLGHTPMGGGKGAYHVQRFVEPSATVTADPSHRKSGGSSCIADPRLSSHDDNYAGSPGLMGVADWSEPSKAVTGSASVTSSNTPAAVADIRFPDKEDRHASHYHVTAWDEPGGTVTGATHLANGSGAVADPRLGCKCRSGSYGVTKWDQPASTVIGSGDIHAGAAAVADPRPFDHTADAPTMVPADGDRGVWTIVSPWNCWHRPLTTLELFALQDFPTTRPDGSPIVLAGKSDRAWRERIGNALPPGAMKAIMEQVLWSLIPSELDEYRMDAMQTGTWVQPPENQPVA